jgi:hypothetical protein
LPLSASPEWFVGRGGQLRGPFQSDQLREFAKHGKIRPSDRVRQGSNGPWRDAASIPGLFGMPDAQQSTTASVGPRSAPAIPRAAPPIATATTPQLPPSTFPDQIACPHCRGLMANDLSLHGQMVACPFCGQQFQMPAIAAPVQGLSKVAPTDSYAFQPPAFPLHAADQIGICDTVQTPPCENCGMVNHFPATSGGNKGRCKECGDPIWIPTLQQHRYRQKQKKAQTRTCRQVLIWGAIIGTALLLVAGIGFYALVKSPKFAAEVAVRERNLGKGEHWQIKSTQLVAHEGDLRVYCLETGFNDETVADLPELGKYDEVWFVVTQHSEAFIVEKDLHSLIRQMERLNSALGQQVKSQYAF